MIKFIFAAVLMIGAVFNSANAMTKAEVEQVVADYIAANGGALSSSIEKFLSDEQLRATQKIIYDTTPSKGPVDAKVTVIEFSDYECPFCSRSQPTMEELHKKYEGKVRFVFKHFPLSFHKNAMGAHLATQAANTQGKFWEFSTQVWENQERLGDPTLYEAIAENIGLDMTQFNTERNSDAVKRMVFQDMKDGGDMGVRGTPYFLINGEALSGALPVSEFVKIIDAALAAE